jgi:hypothetical protein
MLKRLIPIALGGSALLLTMGCTPKQVHDWVSWHDQDPAAAEAFARTPEVQADLADDNQPAPRPARQQSAPAARGASGVNWDKVARCESGGQWSHGQVHNRFGTFSGGLMIMNSAWRNFGGTAFAPYAGAASKAQQIIVAERIAARVGAARAWQCPVG